MTSRTQLSVDLVAKVGGFEAGMKRAANSAGAASSQIRNKIGQIGAAVGASLAAGASVAAVAIKAAIDQADEISKLSQKIGISTEALSGLSVAAQLSDVSIQQLQGGITRLVKSQEDAASGSGELAGVFNAIGVSASNADGSLRDADQVLRDLSDVFAALPDGAEKTALAVQLFGRAGADLIPLLNAGSDGLAEFDALAKRLGVSLSTEAGKNAEAFNDNLTILKIGLQGVATQVASELLPDLVALTNQFAATDTKAKEVAEGVRGVTRFFGGLVDVGKAVKNTIEGVFLGLIALVDAAQALGSVANPFEALLNLSNGESPAEAFRRNVREMNAAREGAADAFGRAGAAITGETVPGAVSAPVVEFITGDNVATAGAGAGAGRRDGEEILDALKKQREEAEKTRTAAEGRAAATRAAAAAERDAAKAVAESKRARDELAKAQADYTMQVEDYAALLAGPLAQAELEWDRRQAQLEDLAKRGQISSEQLKEDLELLTEARLRDIEAQKSQLTPAQQVIADLEYERGLINLSNTEREIANALRYAGVDAMSAEGMQIAENIRLLEEARERIQFGDDIRRGFEDTFASIIDGSKSAKEAFEDLGSYITQLIAQRLASQLTESLFGAPGTPLGGGGGGGIGGFLSSAIGSLFGGGRAAGGFVSPGKMYEVAENGPELLRVGNRQFLLPTATGGMVTPNARMAGGGTVSQTFNVTGRIDARTASQIAAESGRAQRRVSARFGA